jgi:hypothetical protein
LAGGAFAAITACTASAATMMERIGGCAQGQMSQGAVDFFEVAVALEKSGNVPSVPGFPGFPPRFSSSYFRHVHVCRGAFFHVSLDYISDDIGTPSTLDVQR